MPWNTTELERRLRSALIQQFGEESGDAWYAHYVSIREYLLTEVLEEVRGSEPDLTDHGPRHIENVLRNAYRLLGEDHDFNGVYSSLELYVLCVAIWFHDVGNYDGRDKHNQRIGEYYVAARGDTAHSWNQEKTLIIRIGQAHTGLASDGSKDTLKDVPEFDVYEGESIKLRELAALVRFADELAEGPQRTSRFRLARGDISAESEIHHTYASITSIAIDKGNGRIAVTFNIPLKVDEHIGILSEEEETRLTRVLNYCYNRLIKLDQERKYARFYAETTLSSFKIISVQFNFHVGSAVLNYAPSCVLSDKVTPGDNSDPLPIKVPELNLEAVLSALHLEIARQNCANPSN